MLVVLLLTLIALMLHACGGPSRTGASRQTRPQPPPKIIPSEPIPERPVHFGIALPIPDNLGVFAVPKNPGHALVEASVPVVLTIDTTGKVTEVALVDSVDSAYVSYYRNYLTSLSFGPGERDGQPAVLRLPINLRIGVKWLQPIVQFPVDNKHRVRDRRMYQRALELNGVTLPSVKMFPKYSASFTFADTTIIPRYALFEVDLDSTGTVLESRTVESSALGVTDQLKTAINWGEYAPLQINGAPKPTTTFLLITLYSSITYPTKVWTPSTVDSANVMDLYRIEILPDTIGYLIPATPRHAWSGWLSVGRMPDEMTAATVSLRLIIDTLGNVTTSTLSRETNAVKLASLQIAGNLRFYPETVVGNRPRRSYGLCYFEADSSTSVRIWFDWLPLPHSVYDL